MIHTVPLTTRTGERDDGPLGGRAVSQKALTALVFLLASLLAVVVVVGLAQRILDATGVAVALSSVLTGVVGGAILRSKNQNNGNGGGDSS